MKAELIESVDAEALKQKLIEKYRLHYEREGIHLTDLLGCMRKSYYNKTAFLPPSDSTIWNFVTGLALQEVLIQDEEVVFLTEGDIVLSVDGFTQLGNIKELKTTTKREKSLNKDILEDQLEGKSAGWLKQIMGYCAQLRINKALLLVLSMSIPKELYSYKIEFEEGELQEMRDYLAWRGKELNGALEMGIVPAKEENSFCKDCQYSTQCDMDSRCNVVEEGE